MRPTQANERRHAGANDQEPIWMRCRVPPCAQKGRFRTKAGPAFGGCSCRFGGASVVGRWCRLIVIACDGRGRDGPFLIADLRSRSEPDGQTLRHMDMKVLIVMAGVGLCTIGCGDSTIVTAPAPSASATPAISR